MSAIFFMAVLGGIVATEGSTTATTGSSKIQALELPSLGEDTPDIDLTNEIKIKKIADSLPTYKLKHHNVTKDEVTNIAVTVGVYGAVQDLNDDFLITSGKKSLNHSKNSGKFIYLEDMDITTTNHLLPENEARSKAVKIMEDLGIDSKDLRFSGINYQTVSQGEKKSVPMIQKVYFQQTLNGEDIYGVARVAILLGDQGNLVGVYNLKKDYDLVGNMKLKSIDTAFQQIKSKGLMDLEGNGKDKKGNVTDARVAYYADPNQDYIQPVYLFKGRTDEGTNFTSVQPTILLDINGNTANTYRISVLPTTFFINEEGIVIDKVQGEITEDVFISKLEKLSAPKSK